jgi:hypothetical protein
MLQNTFSKHAREGLSSEPEQTCVTTCGFLTAERIDAKVGSSHRTIMGTTTTGRQEQIDCEPNVIKEILEDAAERIQRRTPFQRVLATVYRVALLPGSAEPESAILEYACRGLNERQERELLDFLARAERISGERYRDSHRISDSYFFPQGRGLPATGIEIASTRRPTTPC